MKTPFLLLLACLSLAPIARPQSEAIPLVDSVPMARALPGTISHYWLRIGQDTQGRPESVPVILVRGVNPGPVLGVVAATHGNELNGIRVIQELAATLDPKNLSGTVLAVPGMNPGGIARHQREHPDGTDLNRAFPGKGNGNRSQQTAYTLTTALLPHLDYLADLHTASFGRENTLYLRADLADDTLARVAASFGADIVLNSKEASAGTQTGGTFRAAAAARGIPGFTVELGDPQVFQPDMIRRGAAGLLQAMRILDMLPGVLEEAPQPIVCIRSYWIYTDQGGMLEVLAPLGERLTQGQPIAVLRDPFGREIRRYTAPQAGVVIGRSTNPAAENGARILHLGIEAPGDQP